MLRTVCIVLAFVAIVQADFYMHSPRGSNNRLDEANRDRNNGNRMFDSQNNNRGGYNVGSVYYYQNSIMHIEWTSQHSCGNPNNACEYVIQYMCDDLLRDGTTTDTIPDTAASDANPKYGRHESWAWYQQCKYRTRNKGLFTANQNLQNRNAAIYTRQNPDGSRNGYECPEERDYYPYWTPTPWRDIAILTNDGTRCAAYQAESQNIKDRYSCVCPASYIANQLSKNKQGFIPIQQAACEATGFYDASVNATVNCVWTQTLSWSQLDTGAVDPKAAPDCRENQWARDNHNGNVAGADNDTSAIFASYDWLIPTTFSHERCALRVRYNISTSDFQNWAGIDSIQSGYANATYSIIDGNANNDPAYVPIWERYGLAMTDVAASFVKGKNADNNAELKASRQYVLKNDPDVNIFGSLLSGGGLVRLQVAIDTTQFARAFQDRSHRFAIRTNTYDGVIHNLQVRGKRGNIVQVYPGTEYDFVPQRLYVRNGDYIHIQWTGSNTNPDNNAGQGKAGTDRHNIVLLRAQVYQENQVVTNPATYGQFGRSYPQKASNKAPVPNDGTVPVTFANVPYADALTLAFAAANSNLSYVQGVQQLGGEMSELDDSGTYFNLKPFKATTNGIYHYLCTRNNNFSNRDQKARLIIGDLSKIVGYLGTAGGNVQGDGANVRANSGALSSLSTVTLTSVSPSVHPESTFGDDPASDYIELMPLELPVNPGSTVQLEINYKPNPLGKATAYRADSYTGSWATASASFTETAATVNTDKGGIFVVATKTNWGAVVGVTIGVLVIIFGVIFFFYRRYRLGKTSGTVDAKINAVKQTSSQSEPVRV